MNTIRFSFIVLCAFLAVGFSSVLHAASDACQGIKLSTSVPANTLKGGDRLQLSVYPDSVPGSAGHGTSDLELVVHTSKRELARSMGGKIEFTIPTQFSERDPSIILAMGDGYDELAIDLTECIPGWSLTGYTIDSTPPTITSTVTTDRPAEANRFFREVLVKANDSNSGIELMTVEVFDPVDRKVAEGELKLDPSANQGQKYFAVPIKLTMDTSGGIYRFVVRVMDRVGNASTTTLITDLYHSIYLDTPPPPSHIAISVENQNVASVGLQFTLPLLKAKAWLELDSSFITGKRQYAAKCAKNGMNCHLYMPFRAIIKTTRMFGKPKLFFVAESAGGRIRYEIPSLNSDLLKKMLTPVEDDSPNPLSFYRMDINRK